jgi:N-acetylmuramoyl-L-alanine amidase
VVVELSEETTFRSRPPANPSQLVIELRGSLPEAGDSSLKIQDGLVQQALLSRNGGDGLLLSLELKGPATKHNVFVLPRVDGRPHRLVVDVESQETGLRIQEERRAVQREKGGKGRVVVIDPGHGGEDPGALGVRGSMEKDVVLSIAKVLQARLNQTAGTRAFLTRNGDYFLPLRQRVEIAKDYGADLFLSIHADASHNRSTRGASVYCLSLSGATDEASRILAEKENASDLIGGAKLSGDHNLNSILLDLVQTKTVNDSLKWGSMVLGALGKVQEIKFPNPRQAGFRVLKAPDVPSVLVEVGFVTHPEEERVMKTADFHERVAQALDSAVHRFLGVETSVQTVAAPRVSQPLSKKKEHVVKPGQNLSNIAMLYHTSVRELRSLNDLRDASHIRPGQRLLVP